MEKRMVFLTVVVVVILLISTVASVYAAEFNPQPEPPGIWAGYKNDLRSINKEISEANGKLTAGGSLPKPSLLKSRENMANLLQALRTKAKGLEETKGQEQGVLDTCNKMKPKLDSLELVLKNLSTAIQRGDKPTAQGLLNQIGETVKGMEGLIAK